MFVLCWEIDKQRFQTTHTFPNTDVRPFIILCPFCSTISCELSQIINDVKQRRGEQVTLPNIVNTWTILKTNRHHASHHGHNWDTSMKTWTQAKCGWNKKLGKTYSDQKPKYIAWTREVGIYKDLHTYVHTSTDAVCSFWIAYIIYTFRWVYLDKNVKIWNILFEIQY